MKSNITKHANEFKAIELALNPFYAFAIVKDIIEAEDANAKVSIEPIDLSLTWNSRVLLAPIKLSALEFVDEKSQLWIEYSSRDKELAELVTKKIEASLAELAPAPNAVEAEGKEPASAIEVLEELMADPAWSACVKVLPSAITGAKDSPYASLALLKSNLLRLAAFAVARRTRRGIAPEALAEELGLGSVYRRHISFTAANKYRSDYTARWNGASEVFQEHLTLGGGLSPVRCLSAHFIFDDASGKIVIGRMGKHGECTLSNS